MSNNSQFPTFKFNNIPLNLRLKMINFSREVEDFLTYSLAYWLYINLTKNGLLHLRYYHLNEKRFLIPTYLIDLTNSEILSDNHLFSFYESSYFYNLKLENLDNFDIIEQTKSNTITSNNNTNNTIKELVHLFNNIPELDEIYNLYIKLISSDNKKYNNLNNDNNLNNNNLNNNLNNNNGHINYNYINLNLNDAPNQYVYVTFRLNPNNDISDENYNIFLSFDKNHDILKENSIKENGKFSKINYKLKGNPKDNNFWLLNAQEIIIMMGVSVVYYNQSYFDVHEHIANLYLHKKITLSHQISFLTYSPA